MNAIPRPEYPRPQFVRKNWVNLNGTWTFELDPGKSGMQRGLEKSTGFASEINVPFCPESKLSGVEHKDFIESMFYHRKLEIPADWTGKRLFLHLGAVDYECEGYINGKLCGRHIGGNTDVCFDLTDFVKPGETCDFVLFVKDELRTLLQTGGKQSHEFGSFGCLYTRTTGIWQTVWMEPVAEGALLDCKIQPDLDNGNFVFTPQFLNPVYGSRFKVEIFAEGKPAGSGDFSCQTAVPVSVKLSTIRTWGPEDPFLYDVRYTVTDKTGKVLDTVEAYAGLRKIHLEGSRIFLNNKEIFLRFVLDQGFYPEGVWTAPSDADLKRDIELSMAAGFNGARLHQKVFEPRFHYWADKLGYLTWGESPSWNLRFCGNPEDNAATWHSLVNFLDEWKKIIVRDFSHPSIIAWTPLNECWPQGGWPFYRRILTEVYDTTHLMDPYRPCNETSGYHHVKTDLWTVHLYRQTPEELQKDLFPENRPVWMMEGGEEGYHGQPYVNDEFGGYMFIPPERQKFAENTWGYYGISLKSGEELCEKIAAQVRVMMNNKRLAGFCYTQLTDVEQEQNGVYNYDRTFKVDPARLKKAFAEGK